MMGVIAAVTAVGSSVVRRLPTVVLSVAVKRASTLTDAGETMSSMLEAGTLVSVLRAALIWSA